MADETFSVDVSYFQVAVTDAYTRPWLIFRVCDGTFVDPNFADNWAWARDADIAGFSIYAVYRPNVDIVSVVMDTVTSQPGSIGHKFIVEQDIENWHGEIVGNHSDQINNRANGFAHWLGDRRRSTVYGNWYDLANIYPDRPTWIKIRIADWGAQNPRRNQQLGWQYTDGQISNPIYVDWPRSSAPFGECDHNHWNYSPNKLARLYGLSSQTSTQPPEPDPPPPDPDPPPPPDPVDPPAPQPEPHPPYRPGTDSIITPSGLDGPLGIGAHRAYIYDKGGEYRLGEITPLASVEWHRVRDDISTATIVTAGFGPECCGLMAELHSMRHELVLFRDNVRVWEGPITLITYEADKVTITAHDVMYYIFRRILKSGYDDRYIRTGSPPDVTIVNNIKTVVERAVLLTNHALSRDDPNVQRYVTRFDRTDDSQESRHILPYQKTVWEEIDELASRHGLDYTVVGRRIMYWDVHNVIGRLQQWDDSTFLAHPIITEYGASLATLSAVTDGLGNYGVAGGEDYYYGFVEVLASSYSGKGPPAHAKHLTKLNQDRIDAEAKCREARSAFLRYPGLTADEEAQLAAWESERATPGVTPDRQAWLDAHIAPLRDRANKKTGLETAMNHACDAFDDARDAQTDAQEEWDKYMKALRSQALRNLEGRYPTPVVVRIPDNSQLNPSVDIGINNLVPGVWVPLRSDATCRQLTQWQKLDQVTVTSDPAGGEKITVTLIPAPDHGRTPVDVSPTEP